MLKRDTADGPPPEYCFLYIVTVLWVVSGLSQLYSFLFHVVILLIFAMILV